MRDHRLSSSEENGWGRPGTRLKKHEIKVEQWNPFHRMSESRPPLTLHFIVHGLGWTWKTLVLCLSNIISCSWKIALENKMCTRLNVTRWRCCVWVAHKFLVTERWNYGDGSQWLTNYIEIKPKIKKFRMRWTFLTQSVPNVVRHVPKTATQHWQRWWLQP